MENGEWSLLGENGEAKRKLSPLQVEVFQIPRLSNKSKYQVFQYSPYTTLDRINRNEALQSTAAVLLKSTEDLKLFNVRHAGKEEQHYLRVLPRAVCGHHLHHQHQTENSVLFLQPDSSLCSHRVHGRAGLHAATGLWGETVTR